MTISKQNDNLKSRITKRVEFSASHRCWNPSWSAEKNLSVYGKESNVHGHNFILEVTVEGEIDEQTGMIINLFDLKKIVADVLNEFDHKYLNEDLNYFKELIPTLENISFVIWTLVSTRLKEQERSCRLVNIRLYETPDLFVDYKGE